MEITNEMESDYLSSGCRCPVCQGDNCDHDEESDDWRNTEEGFKIHYRRFCKDCEARWSEVYTYSHIQDLDATASESLARVTK